MARFPDIKTGIKFNGVDIANIDPQVVKEVIQSDDTGIVKSVIQNKLKDWEEEVVRGRTDYAKEYGRPSLEEVPFGQSENDGYDYLPGHAPNCSGPDSAYVGGCWCAQMTSTRDRITGYNSTTKPMWPGGPTMDEFDM